MNREEVIIERKFGRKSPFTVPDGYFEDFTSGMMDKLPEREARVIQMRNCRWNKLRQTIMIAASVCAVMFSIGAYINRPKSIVQEKPSSVKLDKSSTYSVIDEAADYTMLENEQIYAYVTEK